MLLLYLTLKRHETEGRITRNPPDHPAIIFDVYELYLFLIAEVEMGNGTARLQSCFSHRAKQPSFELNRGN